MQGRLAALRGTPAEGSPLVRRGHVARIQEGEDFFVALADHTEWGHAFTVWGEVLDDAGLATLEQITRLPYHEQAGAGGTIMRLLDLELPVTAAIRAAPTLTPSTHTPSSTPTTESNPSAAASLNTEL